MERRDIWDQVAQLQSTGVGMVVVTITDVRGSVPGELGGKAVVTAEGLVGGTLGGGRVEAKAVEEAISLLRSTERCATRTWNLQRDVGMTCGGEMSFLFERVAAQRPWQIVVFGAGHISQALIPVLATLRCRIDVVDERADWLERFSCASNVNTHHVEHFEQGVKFVQKESMVVCISKGHATDRPVLRDVLRAYPEIPFLGAIGSAAKRAVLMRELKEDGLPQDLLDRVVCPLGLPIGGNNPAEIAISIAGQLLQKRGEVECPDECNPLGERIDPR